MDRRPSISGSANWFARLSPGGLLAALVLLATLLQGWRIARAPVPAPDCIRLIAEAQAIDSQGLATVLPRLSDPPLFPTLVVGTHRLQAQILGPRAAAWVMAAQLVAAVAAVAAIVPLWWLLQQVFDHATTAWACALFAVTSHVSRLGADGLADSTHLCLYLVALACAGQAVACTARSGVHVFGRSTAWAAATGLAVGVALWARAEAVVLLPAVGAAMFGLGIAAWRGGACGPVCAGAHWAGQIAALVLGVSVALLPCAYWLPLADTDDPLRAAMNLLQGRPESRELLLGGDPQDADTTFVAVTAATPIARTAPGLDGGLLKLSVREAAWEQRLRGVLPAAASLLTEWITACDYWPAVLAGLGWRVLPRRRHPVVLLWLVLAAMYLVAAGWVAARVGYLSTRHLLPLLPMMVGFSAGGARWLVNRFATENATRWWPAALRGAGMAATLGVAGVVFSAAPLHASRGAHRQAGDWLAAHAAPGDRVLDTQGFSALYSGHATYRLHAVGAALADAALAYVVVESRELEMETPRGRTLRRVLEAGGQRLVCFDGMDSQSFRHPVRGRTRAVEIHRWQPAREARAEPADCVVPVGAEQLTGLLPCR